MMMVAVVVLYMTLKIANRRDGSGGSGGATNMVEFFTFHSLAGFI